MGDEFDHGVWPGRSSRFRMCGSGSVAITRSARWKYGRFAPALAGGEHVVLRRAAHAVVDGREERVAGHFIVETHR